MKVLPLDTKFARHAQSVIQKTKLLHGSAKSVKKFFRKNAQLRDADRGNQEPLLGFTRS